MADPMRVRAQLQGNGAVVRVLMAHEMETGQRKDSAGKTVAAWHISKVTAAHSGRVVLTALWGTGIAKNPLTEFSLKNARVGDRISISWTNTRGERRTDETVVVA